MSDVVLRERPSRAQTETIRSSQTVLASLRRANDPLPPLETTVHPIAVAIPLSTFFWFVVATWIGFSGGETSLFLAVITFLGLMYFSLMAGGGAKARDVRIGPTRRRSFKEFLDGDVEIASGRVRGRQALEQMATLPMTLAVGGSIIIAIAISARP